MKNPYKFWVLRNPDLVAGRTVTGCPDWLGNEPAREKKKPDFSTEFYGGIVCITDKQCSELFSFVRFCSNTDFHKLNVYN